MSNNIHLKILGDFGPFSREGRCISYEVDVAGENYLVDCGAPLFKQLGGHHLKEVRGLFVTHCHDDHKRWFTDLALFHRYAKDIHHKLTLFTICKPGHCKLKKLAGFILDIGNFSQRLITEFDLVLMFSFDQTDKIFTMIAQALEIIDHIHNRINLT